MPGLPRCNLRSKPNRQPTRRTTMQKPSVKPELVNSATQAKRKSPLDPKTLAACRAAALANNWKLFHQLAKPYPTIRLALGLFESYALIEHWADGPVKPTAGWVKMGVRFKDVMDAVRIVKERRVFGRYRIISIK